MLDETMQVLLEHGMNTDLAFLRFVASKVDENKSMQRELMGLMGQLYGNALVRTPLKDSAEIDNASARLMTVYELEGPTTSRSVRDRRSASCCTAANAAGFASAGSSATAIDAFLSTGRPVDMMLPVGCCRS